MAAVKAHDDKSMLAVLGSGARKVIYSGDAVADHAGRERFAAAYDEANKLDMQGDAKAILSVGKDAWPFPIPVVKAGDGWRFDAKQGAEEILNRRIGRNELSTVQALGAYVDAQREYYLLNPAKDKLLQYAQKVVSSEGQARRSVLPHARRRAAESARRAVRRRHGRGIQAGEGGKPVPYYGYYYRVLKAQGPDAKGGAYDYVARGKMIGGFAMVAYPATYGNSGIMTFIVNHDGAVYEKDLGPKTAAIAAEDDEVQSRQELEAARH